jgi:hypothetical protein
MPCWLTGRSSRSTYQSDHETRVTPPIINEVASLPNLREPLGVFPVLHAEVYTQLTMSVQIDQALTDKMVERAITACAESHFAGDERRVRQALVRGQCENCKCVSDALVHEIGAYFGQVAGSVKTIYQYEALDASQAALPADHSHSGIHLIAWVERKSPALRALTGTLESFMAESKRKLGCPNTSPDCFTLNIELVDDRDVHERRGFGLLIDSPLLRSQPIWRSNVSVEAVVKEEAGEGRVHYELPDSFDPELIPESRLLDHARSIENLAAQDRAALEHHLLELKVTLIRRIISDQLEYINIARDWFTVGDLAEIYQRRLGFGRIGGKAAGMLLAGRILMEVASEETQAAIRIPESFFLGSDLMYIFMAMNGLMHWNDQKYKPEDQIREEYPQIREDCLGGEFPPEILIELEAMLKEIGTKPLIVRSSSQLEDSLGTTFAGKYDSYFLPNQSDPQHNLREFTRAIAKTYASTFKPEALLYRRRRGLQDYDERMAVLIQVVQGETWEKYYLPFAAGVAFSQNLYRWAPQIRREDGFVRMVWGLGTRAVERTGDDYPRLVALSHPTLQPDDETRAILHYSQKYVDLIDLEENTFKTLPIEEVLSPRYPALPQMIQIHQDGYLSTPRSLVSPKDIPNAAITFDKLLSSTPFPGRLSAILKILEEHWHSPVDVEFTAQIPDPGQSPAEVKISLLQCRPLPRLQTAARARIPKNLPEEDIIFSSHFIVPSGHIPRVDFALYVDPSGYFGLPDGVIRNELARAIGRLNAALEGQAFICVGPGRWGTANFDLGVYVGYADICNARALVELSGEAVGPAPEPSFGTHFFHDLMEAQIYPIAVDLDHEMTTFNQAFFTDSSNRVREWIKVSDDLEPVLRLITVEDHRPKHHIEIIMDDEKGHTLAFLAPHA